MYFELRFAKITKIKKDVKDENGFEFVGANIEQESEYFENNVEYQRKAYIVVRATKDDAGTVVRVNLLFSALFGYSKEDIITKKINILMPELYALNHNDFLNRFLENSAADQFYESKYLNVNQNFYGKNKSGYIFPMTSKVIFLKEQLSFIATFVPQLITRTNLHIISNKEGTILDISASVIHFLRIDLVHIRKNKISINDFIPNLVQEREKYTTNPVPISMKIFVDNQEMVSKFNCVVGNIDFCIIEQDMMFEDGAANEEAKIQKNFGFWVKLEKIDNVNIPAPMLSPKSKIKKDVKLNLGYKTSVSPECMNFKFEVF